MSARPTKRKSTRAATRSAPSSGRRASRRTTTTLLMGRDGARVVVVNSTGREISELRRDPAGRRQRRPADARPGDAEGGRRRLSHARLLGLGHRARSPQRRRADAGQPARPTIRTRLWPASIARRIRRSSPTSCGRCRIARFRDAIRRARLSSWWSRRRRSKRDSSRPSFRVNCPGRRQFLRPLVSVSPQERPRQRRPAPRDREVVQRLLLHARQHARRRSHSQVGGQSRPAGRSGIDLPNEQDSLVPSSEWKKQRTGERWYPGETISVAIGQGQNSVTPMGLAVMMSTLANGGTRHVPRLVQGGGRWRGVEGRAPAGKSVSAVACSSRETVKPSTMVCGWPSMAPARQAGRALPAATSPARPAPPR